MIDEFVKLSQTLDVDAMELAWGVDIEPVLAMVSIAFGELQFSFLNLLPFYLKDNWHEW